MPPSFPKTQRRIGLHKWGLSPDTSSYYWVSCPRVALRQAFGCKSACVGLVNLSPSLNVTGTFEWEIGLEAWWRKTIQKAQGTKEKLINKRSEEILLLVLRLHFLRQPVLYNVPCGSASDPTSANQTQDAGKGSRTKGCTVLLLVACASCFLSCSACLSCALSHAMPLTYSLVLCPPTSLPWHLPDVINWTLNFTLNQTQGKWHSTTEADSRPVAWDSAQDNRPAARDSWWVARVGVRDRWMAVSTSNITLQYSNCPYWYWIRAWLWLFLLIMKVKSYVCVKDYVTRQTKIVENGLLSLLLWARGRGGTVTSSVLQKLGSWKIH